MTGDVEKPIVVLKFGSSVLVDRARLPDLVSEIYRVVRTGRRVVAVTSAFDGVTDNLIAEAQAFGCPHDNVNAPAYIATGEEALAALAALACDRSGLCAIALKTPELGILATGPHDESDPIGMRSTALQHALDSHDVVIVPGFVATNPSGATVLLGRGGSDLTAVFLASILGAERIRLVKDVDGVYDRDPAAENAAQRYHHIHWDLAREVAGKLIQTRALDYAAAKGLSIEVGAISSDSVTVVGQSAAPPEPPIKRRKLRVALAGYGVVGAGVAQRLLQRPDEFEIVGVLVRDAKRGRGDALRKELFCTDPAVLLSINPDVIVDVLSSGTVGAELSLSALAEGIHVVSANKQALAANYTQLEATAALTASRLLNSASVGGGAPLLEMVAIAREGGACLVEIEGVLNGTVNYLLEQLSAGISYEAAVQSAQRAGLAEEDPTADLSGADAAAKLQLLALQTFGRAIPPENLTVERLTPAVAKSAANARLRQLARVTDRDGQLIGAIQYVPAAGLFAELSGDRNAIRIKAADGRTWNARGRGAGRWPTTESVFADLIDLSTHREAATHKTAIAPHSGEASSSHSTNSPRAGLPFDVCHLEGDLAVLLPNDKAPS